MPHAGLLLEPHPARTRATMVTLPYARRWWINLLAGLFATVAGLSGGCHDAQLRPADFSGRTPIVRVLVLSARSKVTVTADVPPTAKLLGDPEARHVDLAPGTPVTLTLTRRGWQLGSATIVGQSDLSLIPAVEGAGRGDNKAYRGRFRFVPRPPTAAGAAYTFDVVNDVDVENYLRGVVAKEMPNDFLPAAYAAQTVVARTYALYMLKSASRSARFDLYADERSQMYGGLAGESPKALAAVDATEAQVVAYGPPEHERIFKAYYSSCCGGRGQSNAEAFAETPIAPLAAQSCGTLCAASPSYTWAPIIVTKAELTRRIRKWGANRGRPERDLAPVQRISIAAANGVGRPIKFTVTDAKGRRFTLSGEEIRNAVNTDAPPKGRLPSSLFRPDDRGDAVAFDNGHGRGHGVGMCQYCAQARAQAGGDYRQIVTAAFPGAVILRAY